MPNKKDTGGIYQSLPTSEKTMDNHALSYKSPFTYADIKKSDGYSSFVDIEDSREEYEQAKQSCLLRSVAPDCRLLKLENILFAQMTRIVLYDLENDMKGMNFLHICFAHVCREIKMF